MYALGHIALGYIVSKGICKVIGRPVNIFLVIALSVLPDIDFFLPGVYHRGITHSIVLSALIFLPFLIRDFNGSIPYLGALISHSFIGDFFTGDVLLFWPLSSRFFKYSGFVPLKSSEEAYLEIILFSVFVIIFTWVKEYNYLEYGLGTLLLLFIPFGAVLASILLIRFSYQAQKVLLLPHIVILVIIGIPYLSQIYKFIERALA